MSAKAKAKLTPEQRKATLTRVLHKIRPYSLFVVCSLIVAAAAGSGKTAVLVERIITKLLREEQEIDRLLVVTFTNAAASEMRQRKLF